MKKLPLVNWSIVFCNKKNGGLGIRNLSSLNKALLGKWCRRFAYESESLWKNDTAQKFGEEEEGWCTKTVRDDHGLAVWKAIRNG